MTLPKGRVRAEIFRAARPDLRFRLLVVFSCVIATLGLVGDSTAVVIGAMLVAPLLGPIMALALALLGGARREPLAPMWSLAEGTLTAIVVSYLLTELLRASPFAVLETVPGEIQARTRPNPLDLGIALAGGAVGAYGLVRLRAADALPGVAIATALMPPLCTVGIGLSLGDRGIWGGALLLFVTNLSAIISAAAFVFLLSGVRHRTPTNPGPRLLISLLPVLVVGVTLAALTGRAVQEAREEDQIAAAVREAVLNLFPHGNVERVTRSSGDDGSVRVRVEAQVDREATVGDAETIQAYVAQRTGKRIQLVLVTTPVLVLDPLNPPPPDVRLLTPTPTVTPTPTATAAATHTPTPTRTASPTRGAAETGTPGSGTAGGGGAAGGGEPAAGND
ncbi:MAG: hypothetical protein KatS3mg062_1546 [Tepidiforma sp.]|nr:MAG: hypothetical protein KatS3mg062_1546 [Tepidiforma sp.]